MKIKQLDIADFKGIKGPVSYPLGHVTALCQKNGSGKTSFLSALRYGLTGVEPDGEMVRLGAARAVVQIETESGNKYGRAKYAQKGKASKYYFGGKACTLADLNQRLQAENGGVMPETAKIASSGELIASLNAQKFGELVMQYLPEALETDQIISMLPEPSDRAAEIIKGLLPKEEFGADMVDKAYDEAVLLRRQLKKKITEADAVVKNMSVQAPAMTEEQLKKAIAQTQKERDEAVAFKARKDAYDAAVAAEKNRVSSIELLEKQISQITASPDSLKLRDETARALQSAKDAGNAAYLAMKEIQKEASLLKKAVDTIRQPVCPLSEKLKCTTDKTPIIEELQARMNELRDLYNKRQAEYNNCANQVKTYTEKYADYDKQAQQYLLLTEKQKMKKELEAKKTELPPMPVAGKEVSVLDAAMENMRKDLVAIQKINTAKKMEEEIAVDRQELAELENIVGWFSPKGIVKEQIRDGYMRDFAAGCNEKAKNLFGGMQIMFNAENGVETMVDIGGTGTYIPYSALSGGERACVTYILMDMLSRLSGFKTIILDELSVLDKETLDALLTIIMQHKDEYDLVLIAAVNHDDTMAVIRDHGIPVITV